MLNSQLPLECKTVAEWLQEVQRQSYRFREKYERCFHNRKYSIDSMNFYKKASNIYSELSDLLSHLVKYKSPTSDRCLSCKHTPGHTEKLEQNYNKYYRNIMRCRDGYHYSKENINAF